MHRRSGLRPPRWSNALMWAVLASTVVITGFMWMTTYDQPLPSALATVVLIGAPVLALSLRGRLTIDAENLVMEIVPVFRKTVPRAEIRAATRTEVDPMRDFGGYGYRLRGGGLIGFVHEAGPAVRVETRSGKTYVISDPEADHVVTLLTSRSSPEPRR